MKTAVLVLITAIVGTLAGVIGYVAYESYQSRDTVSFRPAFELPDFDGNPQSIEQWDGQVIVLNFWASWCPPCVREIPAFVELQEQYGPQGVQFVGVAIDRLDKAQEFAEKLGVNYPQMHGGQAAMKVVQDYGNYSGTLPYTVVIDRDGRIDQIFAKEVEHATMAEAIEKLLR